MTTVPPSAPGDPARSGSAPASASKYAPLTHDLDVDVCVVGGGLAGLTVARELARRGWSVAVLEARRIAWSASGRNGGFVLPGFAEDIEAIIDRVGLSHAQQLWALSVEGVEYVRGALRELRIPGIATADGFLKVSLSDQAQALARRAARMQGEFGANVELWSTEQVRAVLLTDRYFQALQWPQAFHLHPLTYALGLASAAQQAGARIFEKTAAVTLDVSGVRKRVDTPAGRVRAHHVVLAGGAHLGSLFTANSGTVMPIVSYLAATAPLGDQLHQAIRYAGGVADMRLGGDHYRAVHGNRLLWGGGISTHLTVPQVLGQRIEQRIREIYPQLGPVKVTYAVSGVMGYAMHKMPQIGEIAPGVWLASAFGAHGLNTTAMAGELIARAIVEGDDRWRLFAPYELVWVGGSLGRATMQCVFWVLEGRHRLHQAVTRYRRARRRRPRMLLLAVTDERPIPGASVAPPDPEPRNPSGPAETHGANADAAQPPDETFSRSPAPSALRGSESHRGLARPAPAPRSPSEPDGDDQPAATSARRVVRQRSARARGTP